MKNNHYQNMYLYIYRKNLQQQDHFSYSFFCVKEYLKELEYLDLFKDFCSRIQLIDLTQKMYLFIVGNMGTSQRHGTTQKKGNYYRTVTENLWKTQIHLACLRHYVEHSDHKGVALNFNPRSTRMCTHTNAAKK